MKAMHAIEASPRFAQRPNRCTKGSERLAFQPAGAVSGWTGSARENDSRARLYSQFSSFEVLRSAGLKRPQSDTEHFSKPHNSIVTMKRYVEKHPISDRVLGRKAKVASTGFSMYSDYST